MNQNQNKLSVQDKIKFFDKFNKTTKENPKSKKELIKLEEKGDLTIYEYPNINFSISDFKVLLILGNAQNDFIKTFINIYSNVSYADKKRFSIKNDDNKKIIAYNIESKTEKKN